MASQVLPQALLMVPRNPIQSRNLGFSTFLSRAPSPLITAQVSVSGLRLSNSVFGSFSRKEFVVRAEASPEGEVAVEAEAEAEAGEDAGSEEVVEDAKVPFKPRVKLGDIMGILNKQAIEASQSVRAIPDLRTGDIVEIKFEVPSNRRRLSTYKGIVMSKQNAGIHTTIRIRRIIAGIGVEIVFPIYSPNVKEIRVVKHRKVRQARLYYLRDKLPRLSTFK